MTEDVAWAETSMYLAWLLARYDAGELGDDDSDLVGLVLLIPFAR